MIKSYFIEMIEDNLNITLGKVESWQGHIWAIIVVVDI